MKENIRKIIVKDIVGDLTSEERLLLHDWLQAEKENIKRYAQIRDLVALNSALTYRAKNKDQIYNKIRNKNYRRRTMLLKVASVAAVIAVAVAILWSRMADDPLMPNEPLIADVQSLQMTDVVIVSNGNEYKVGADVEVIDIEGAELRNSSANEMLEFKVNANRQPENVVISTIKVPAERTYKVVLPDGTQVTLNAQSTLTFPSQFNGSTREVTLTGEALFNVTHDPKKRFIVKTGKKEVRVYGTVFNVNAYDDVQVVSLISGSVVTGNGLVEKRLIPGEQAFVQENFQIEVSKFNVDEVLAWERAQFLFDDKPLSDIVTAFEQWYGVKFKFNENKLKNVCAYVKVRRTTPLDELLKIISATNKLKFQFVENEILIYQNE